MMPPILLGKRTTKKSKPKLKETFLVACDELAKPATIDSFYLFCPQKASLCFTKKPAV